MHTLTKWIIAEAISIIPLLFLYNYLLLLLMSNPKVDALFLYSVLEESRVGPVGLAAYGIYPNLSTYSINSTEIVGLFNITNFSVYSTQFFQNFFSLQLNAPLAVGSNVIFPQAGLEISNNSVFFVDNLANIYGPAFNVAGRGNLSKVIIGCNSTFVNSSRLYSKAFYGYASNLVNISLPIRGKLFMKILKINPLQLELGGNVNNYSFADIINTSLKGKANFLASSKFLVVPIFLNPGALTASPELVFAGSGCGNVAIFHYLNASLSLLYLNNNTLKVFPSFYSLGADIAEAAENVTPVFSCKNGAVRFISGYGQGWISCN
jgi:hypothetical protein